MLLEDILIVGCFSENLEVSSKQFLILRSLLLINTNIRLLQLYCGSLGLFIFNYNIYVYIDKTYNHI